MKVDWFENVPFAVYKWPRRFPFLHEQLKIRRYGQKLPCIREMAVIITISRSRSNLFVPGIRKGRGGEESNPLPLWRGRRHFSVSQ